MLEKVKISSSSLGTRHSYTGQYILVQIANTHILGLDSIHKKTSNLSVLIQEFKK